MQALRNAGEALQGALKQYATPRLRHRLWKCCRRYVCKVAKRTLAWQRYALRIQQRLKHTRKINAVTYFYVALIESHACNVVDYP